MIKLLPFVLSMLCQALLLGQGYSERNLTRHPAQDRYASYSPDGQYILFESNRNGNWDIFLMHIASGQLRQLTHSELDERRPSWRPDGQAILFEATRDGQQGIYELGLAQKLTRLLMPESRLPGQAMFARYSPDGRAIALTVKESETVFHLYVHQEEVDTLFAISQDTFRSVYPSWHPRGRSLLCHSRRDTRNQVDEIYCIKLASGRWKRLTHWPTHNFCPAWSPNGRRIAYVTSMEDIRPEIYIMNKNGKGRQRITFNEDGDTLPQWHPSGKKLLITGFREDNFEILEVELE